MGTYNDLFGSEKTARSEAFKTGLENLYRKSDLGTKRMAGAALLAALTPGTLAMTDNRDENFLQEFASGGITLGGIGLGAYIEHEWDKMSDDEKEFYIENEINDLKRQSKETMKDKGPQVANEEFARAKQRLLEMNEPIDTNPGRRKVARENIGFDILGMTPRTLRGTSRGALLGAVASIPLAYGVMRGEEIE